MVFKRILIAVNDSEPACWAVDLGCALADNHAAHVQLLHVVNRTNAFVGDFDVPATALLGELRREGQAVLDRFAKKFAHGRTVEAVLREGKPADEIIAVAQEWSRS